MESPKHYFVEGFEKYQHFSTGLMFAVAAAAIQSAKLDGAGGIQTGLEVFSWVLLIFAAVIGLFNARAVPLLMMAHDSVYMIQDRMNRTLTNDPDVIYIEKGKDGEDLHMNKDQHFEYLQKDFETSMVNYDYVRSIIDRRTSVQVWAFTLGLVFLAGARVVPHFSHSAHKSVVISVDK